LFVATDREQSLLAALRDGGSKAPAARRQRRGKMVKRRPWKVLEEEWHEQMHRTFGKDFVSSPWKVHEPKLARKLLDEVDLDVAIKMVKQCIESWDKPGTPGFGYLWAARDSIRAEVLGQVKTRREMVDSDEYNEERDGHLPKIGW
jgi:hypothetical protein